MTANRLKVVKVRPISFNTTPSLRKLPAVLLAAIKNVYGQPYRVKHIEAGHYRMETRLCNIDYTVPQADGKVCLMRAYRKGDKKSMPDVRPFCVAQYILEAK